VVEKVKTRSMLSNVFRKSYPLRDNMEKYCRTGQAKDDNTEYAHCLLDT